MLRQLHRRLLVGLGQVPPKPQKVMARPQHRRLRHRAGLQSRRAVRRFGRHRRICLLLGLEDVQDVPQDPRGHERRSYQLCGLVGAGDE